MRKQSNISCYAAEKSEWMECFKNDGASHKCIQNKRINGLRFMFNAEKYTFKQRHEKMWGTY